MKVSMESFITKEPPLAIIIVGDGREDVKVLEAIGEKLDHESFLVYSRLVGRIGLVGAADSLSELVSRIKAVSRYLVVIDREHIRDVKDFELVLQSRGFRILEKKSCYDVLCWRFIVEKGDRRVVVVLSIQGRERCIEENEAELIRLCLGETVAADKKSIRELLRRRSIGSVKDLIKQCNDKALELAFTSLIHALNEIKYM
jgi:hypothetical protein